MKGQWLGSYGGSVDGKIMINIDETASCYGGVAYIMPNNKTKFPISVAHFQTEDKSYNQALIAQVNPVDKDTGFQTKWEMIKKSYDEDVSHSDICQVYLMLEANKLHITSFFNNDGELTSTLEKSNDTNESKIIGEPKSWIEFKDLISGMEGSKYLFRGQKEPWRLRTTFHRGERYRISEFTGKDVKHLHQRLSAITTHYFDLTVPDQNGAFFNLLQHHGYPTPLLDWSYSPYVSAFFAFRSWPIGFDGEGDIRIYIFDNEAWQNKYTQIQNLDPPFPHLSVMEFIAIDNPRLVPQQAITTVTNLDDIEAYILAKEVTDSAVYIRAIDIPAKEREVAMRELRFMGITAGSMFPSIDGVCEELRERNFNV